MPDLFKRAAELATQLEITADGRAAMLAHQRREDCCLPADAPLTEDVRDGEADAVRDLAILVRDLAAEVRELMKASA